MSTNQEYYIPECHLTDEQAHRMRALGELLAAIASHDTDDLQLRRQMLIAQLALGYEFVKNTGIEYC